MLREHLVRKAGSVRVQTLHQEAARAHARHGVYMDMCGCGRASACMSSKGGTLDLSESGEKGADPPLRGRAQLQLELLVLRPKHVLLCASNTIYIGLSSPEKWLFYEIGLFYD